MFRRLTLFFVFYLFKQQSGKVRFSEWIPGVISPSLPLSLSLSLSLSLAKVFKLFVLLAFDWTHS